MNQTILAVDDSETMRNLVEQTLRLGGYQVILACDGRDALAKFSESRASVVVTDINMPEMNGIELIAEIRKIDRDVPILTLTTESEADMKQRGAKAGANGWVVKPFRPVQLLDIVKQLLG